MASGSTKAAISLKRIKIDDKLLWRAYRISPTLFRTVPSSTPYGLPFPKIGHWGFATSTKNFAKLLTLTCCFVKTRADVR